MRVLITGAAGFIGQQVLADLLVQQPSWELFAADLLPIPSNLQQGQLQALKLDISQPAALLKAVAQTQPQVIVHLALLETTPAGIRGEPLHEQDGHGTRALIEAAAANQVQQLIVISSAAAYGYYPENAEWIDEHDPLRGHAKFPCAKHAREVEELLVQARVAHPQLRQLILRPTTILGKRVAQQVSAPFEKSALLGIKDSDSRCGFIWDQDVVRIIRKGLECGTAGIYNLAGDGALSQREIATILRKPYLPLPSKLAQGLLRILQRLGLSQYGPEQVDFLRYRPVLANRRLKDEFGYTPRYTSREALLAFLDAQGISHG